MPDETTQELTPLDKLREQINDVLTNVSTLEIRTQDQYVASQELLRRLAKYRKDVEAARKTEVAPHNETVKQINVRYKDADALAEPAERQLRQLGQEYRREQERIAQERQAKLLEAQRKEQERLQKRAEQAREKGHEEKAEALVQQAETVPVAVVAPSTPKVEGISERPVWRWEVEDVGLIPREYWVIDEKAIGAVVKSLGERTRIPGVRVWAEKVTVVR